MFDSEVCVAHGSFVPCRKSGEHRYTSNPFWVKAVGDYHSSDIEDLTWEPAWPVEPKPTSRKPHPNTMIGRR